jgi:hypothetical protein
MIHINKYMSNLGKSTWLVIAFALMLCTQAWANQCSASFPHGTCSTNGQTCAQVGTTTTYSCQALCSGSRSGPCGNGQICVARGTPTTYSCQPLCEGANRGVCETAGQVCTGTPRPSIPGSSTTTAYSCVAADVCGRTINGSCPIAGQSCINISSGTNSMYTCGVACSGTVSGICGGSGNVCVNGSAGYSCVAGCGGGQSGVCADANKTCLTTTTTLVANAPASYQCGVACADTPAGPVNTLVPTGVCTDDKRCRSTGSRNQCDTYCGNDGGVNHGGRCDGGKSCVVTNRVSACQ